jgi:hypothetical protein
MLSKEPEKRLEASELLEEFRQVYFLKKILKPLLIINLDRNKTNS